MFDGRRGRIKGQVPHHHDRRANHRDSYGRKPTDLPADIADEDDADHPGEICGGKVRRPDEPRHQEEHGPGSVVVVAERKTGQDAGVFEDVADDETHDEEGQDAAPAIAQRPVDEREHRGRHHHRYGQRGRKRRGRESYHRQEHNQHPKEIDPRFRISHASTPPCLVTQGWGRPGAMSPPIRGKQVLRRLGEANH